MICVLCDRPIIEGTESNHHLIPKQYFGNEKYPIHSICHKQIHHLFSNEVLAKNLNTIDKLRNQHNVKRFINWVQNQPIWIDHISRRKNYDV